MNESDSDYKIDELRQSSVDRKKNEVVENYESISSSEVDSKNCIDIINDQHSFPEHIPENDIHLNFVLKNPENLELA